MPLLPSDLEVLKFLAQYYVLTREQVQQLCHDPEVGGRGTRKKLTRLREAGYITKHKLQVSLPESNAAAPVYSPTRAGAELLASYFDDRHFLATNTKAPRVDLLAHWIAINHTRIIFEEAIAKQSLVTLDGWINEWEVINKDAAVSDQYSLHTQFSQTPALSCSPDAAFMLNVKGHRKVFYLEQDLGTSSPRQVAARKTKGYAELAHRQGHRQHFSGTTFDRFSVLFVTTSDYRCEAGVVELNKRQRPDLWLLVNGKRLNSESCLHGKIVHDYQGLIGPLIKLPGEATSACATASSAGSVGEP